MSKISILLIIILFAGAIFMVGNLSAWAQIANLAGDTPKTSDFILSWSSDSYVPLGYEGKALPTQNSGIKVVAVPIKKLAADPTKLYYRWLIDNEIAGWANGQGKSTLKFPATKWPGDKHSIELQVLDGKETLLARAFTLIVIVDPELLVKQENEDYALTEDLAVGTGKEIKLTAVPLFFHIKKMAEIDWQWILSGQKLSGSDEKEINSLTIKIPQGKLDKPLQKNLQISAANKTDQYQQVSAELNIKIQ
ncbi:hypothetical protein KJ853_03205 [Patescibacteria group bacterium]|nr:hypothetical protein [Patescibacteria group bacterium]